MEGWATCALQKARGGSWLFRCIYGVNDKQGVVRQIGTKRFEDLQRLKNEGIKQFVNENHRRPDQEELSEIIRPVVIKILATSYGDYFLQAARFKDEAFSEEREWRIVFHAVRDMVLNVHRAEPDTRIVKFRPGKFGVTPYIDFPLNLKTNNLYIELWSDLARIRMKLVDAVSLLLAANGIEGVEVVPSKIPYRDW